MSRVLSCCSQYFHHFALTYLLSYPPARPQAVTLPDSVTLQKSRWFQFGRFISRYSIVVVLVVVGLAVPCAMRAVNFDRTMSVLAFTPRTSGTSPHVHVL